MELIVENEGRCVVEAVGLIENSLACKLQRFMSSQFVDRPDPPMDTKHDSLARWFINVLNKSSGRTEYIAATGACPVFCKCSYIDCLNNQTHWRCN